MKKIFATIALITLAACTSKTPETSGASKPADTTLTPVDSTKM